MSQAQGLHTLRARGSSDNKQCHARTTSTMTQTEVRAKLTTNRLDYAVLFKTVPTVSLTVLVLGFVTVVGC